MAHRITRKKGPRLGSDELAKSAPTSSGAASKQISSGHDVFRGLSAEQIASRRAAASEKLAELGGFEDIASVPINALSDHDLDKRIAEVERDLETAPPIGDRAAGDLTPSERAAVLRHLEVIDYLIDHPNASIPPSRTLPAIDTN